MAGYDRDRLGLGPEITREWLRRNAEIAKSIPRGTTTQKGHLTLAAQEYEHRVRSAVTLFDSATHDEVGPLRAALGLPPPGWRATVDSEETGGVRRDFNRWGRHTQDAFGAGRSYERAIHEARFGRAYSNEECLAQSGAWLAGQ